MKKILRLLCIVTAAASAVMMMSPAALAAQPASEYNEQVREMELRLEEKYDLDITYPFDSNGYAAISTGSLYILDETLESITPSLVRQVSGYYRDRFGKRLTYAYTWSDLTAVDMSEAELGNFMEGDALIRIFVPNRHAAISGDSPLTVAHEFGHAFHLMCAAQYGEEQMQQEWLSFNGSYDYSAGNIVENPDELVFASGYGAVSYHEDFAEVFAYGFVCNKAGMGLSPRLIRQNAYTSFGLKMNYIEKLLPLYLTGTEGAASNMQRIYSAPSAVNYRGARLSGAYMQYSGFYEPRLVRDGLLSLLGIRASEVQWISEIGGWYVVSETGMHYVAFPGGIWGEFSEMAA